MKKRVIKFGGSNLKSKEDIAKLIKVVDCYKEPLVIVVSALYGVTDILVGALETVCSDEKAIPVLRKDLIDAHKKIIDLYIDDLQYRQNVLETISQRAGQLAKYLLGSHYIGEVPEFVADKVLSYGERLSSLTLEAILNFKNIRCRERLPEDLGLFTDGRFGCATVDFQISEKSVCEKLKGDETFIVPGFYGISPDSRVTLLGRGGSDYSAAAIARCIHASSVDLWKDVKGFMSADPKLVEHTVVVDTLSYNEAAELSYFGARILHPRTFEPAMEKSIPIRLFNIDDFSPSLEPLTVIEVEEVV
ncbi:MAG: aspartate kinase, partial [bacterium]|nr:aspartate kinase [bacterium]